MRYVIPQLILIALQLIGTGYSFTQHGKTKEPKKHDASVSLCAVLIINLYLFWGGWFDGLIAKFSN